MNKKANCILHMNITYDKKYFTMIQFIKINNFKKYFILEYIYIYFIIDIILSTLIFSVRRSNVDAITNKKMRYTDLKMIH